MQLPSPREIKELYPLSSIQEHFVACSRASIGRMLSYRDQRLAIVAGPCSIHDRETALEYARRFKSLAAAVADAAFLVMRVYTEKPRTTTGWKGFLYDPHLDGSHDILQGIIWTRQLLLELASMEVAVATEFVDPLAAPYFSDLISWGFIGARTSASQPHRQLASYLKLPVGFKNATDGSIEDAIHAVLSARATHSFLYIDDEGRVRPTASRGNPLTHVVLRGATDRPNYDPASVEEVTEKMVRANVHTRLLVDCSHGNCQKQHQRQIDVFRSVIEQRQSGNRQLLGLMLESHLEEGNQPLTLPLKRTLSITDPCIDWETTEELIREACAPAPLLHAQKVISGAVGLSRAEHSRAGSVRQRADASTFCRSHPHL